MKTIRNLAAVLLSASLLTVSVSAAIEFTPSVEEKTAEFAYTETDGQGRPVVGYTRDAEGRLTESISSDAMVITPLSKANTAAQVVRDNISRAEKALRETAIETLIPDLCRGMAESVRRCPGCKCNGSTYFRCDAGGHNCPWPYIDLHDQESGYRTGYGDDGSAQLHRRSVGDRSAYPQ